LGKLKVDLGRASHISITFSSAYTPKTPLLMISRVCFKKNTVNKINKNSKKMDLFNFN